MGTPHPGDTPEVRERRDARLAQVRENKEDTLAVMNAFRSYTDGAMTTDRLAHTDHWNIYMSPKAAADILAALNNGIPSQEELADAWEAGYEARDEWTPVGPTGIPHDPPLNPYDETRATA